MENTMFWQGSVSVPNPHYYCSECDKDLKTRHDRICMKTVPNVTFVGEKQYCDRCFAKCTELNR